MEFFTTTDNIKIYYESKGQGKTIIFIHGFTQNHSSFRIQQRSLSKKYRVITYDVRGHGLSDKIGIDMSLDRCALDLKEFIDYLELENVILVGWSMGTSIILEYISLFGVDNLYKVCIIDKGPKVINDDNWNLGLYHGRYTNEDALCDLNKIKGDWNEFCEKFIRVMAPYFNENQFKISMDKMKNNYPDAMYSIWKSIIYKDYRSILEKITIPVLIIFGEKSTFYSIETGQYLEENINFSRLVVFENCTHLLVLENPIRFNRVLEDFII